MDKKEIYVKDESGNIYSLKISIVTKLTQTERHEVLNRIMNNELITKTCLLPLDIPM